MSDEKKDSRLPPPAFPPGSRRHIRRNNSGPHKARATIRSAVDDDAFISPDDPLPERRDPVAEAFISPDDPLPERSSAVTLGGAATAPEEPVPIAAEELEEGVVTGMGSDPHLEPEELASGGDPYVMEVVQAVAKLAEALKRKGEAGLRTTMDMSRIEATLRGYCVGYIAGRRAEEDQELDLPDWGETMPGDA